MTTVSGRFEVLSSCRYDAGPAANAFFSWPERRGILLSVVVEGARGWGEASPLPGYSPDTEAQVQSALCSLPGTAVSVDTTALWASIRAIADEVVPDARVPSARFAVESALLDAVSTAVAVPPEVILREQTSRIRDVIPAPSAVSEPDDRVVANNQALAVRNGAEGYVVSEPEDRVVANHQPLAVRGVAEVLTQLDTAVRDGVNAHKMGAAALKLKVGREGQSARERRVIEALLEQLPQVPLRIDANRAFATDPGRVKSLASMDIEFFEEPGDWYLPEATQGMTKWAMDESLRLPEAEDLLASLSPHWGALVVKPSVLGGLSQAMWWAERGLAYNVPTVVSHLFDGPVAAQALCTLAKALPSWGPAHGLGLARKHVGRNQ